MKKGIILFLALLAGTAATAQQRQRVTIGGGPGEDTHDWPQPDVREGRTPDQIVAAITDYAQALAASDHFSGVVLVANGDSVKLSRAWGKANDTEANTLETKFNIGSINKVFTRRAIEQLASAGKLSPDDLVSRYLPDYPPAVAGRITIGQLLEHRAGLGDIFGPKYLSAPPARLRELSDFLALFVDEPLQFEPGTAQRYSNAGYVVLGLIIEHVSGQTYRDYLRDHIFVPAGMTSTGFWAVDEPVAHRATGYTMRGPSGPLTARIPNTATLPGRPSSAGGAYSTAGDLLRFAQWARLGGIGVGGGAPGLNAALEVDNGWTVITMANYDPPSAETLARGAMAIVRGRKEEAEERRGPPRVGTQMAADVAVPLETAEHLLTVQATVNGKGPFRFAIDSGAAGNMRVSAELAKTLALETIGMARAGDPSGRNLVEVPIVRIDSVEIGGARFTAVEATISGRPGPPAPDGVIGLGMFSALTATLDYTKHQLRLSREPLSANDPHVVAFTAERGVPQIPVTAAGVRFTADVDTGSPALLSIPPSIKVPLNGEPRVVGHGRTSANEFEIKGADLKGDLQVAGWSQVNPTIDLVDLFPVANLGARFLSQYVVTFDMPNQRMALTH